MTSAREQQKTKINKYKCAPCDLLDTNLSYSGFSQRRHAQSHIPKGGKEIVHTEFVHVFVEVVVSDVDDGGGGGGSIVAFDDFPLVPHDTCTQSRITKHFMGIFLQCSISRLVSYANHNNMREYFSFASIYAFSLQTLTRTQSMRCTSCISRTIDSAFIAYHLIIYLFIYFSLHICMTFYFSPFISRNIYDFLICNSASVCILHSCAAVNVNSPTHRHWVHP